MSFQVEEQLRQLVKIGVPLDRAVAEVFAQRAERAIMRLEHDVFRSAQVIQGEASSSYVLTQLQQSLLAQGYLLSQEFQNEAT